MLCVYAEKVFFCCSPSCRSILAGDPRVSMYLYIYFLICAPVASDFVFSNSIKLYLSGTCLTVKIFLLLLCTWYTAVNPVIVYYHTCRQGGFKFTTESIHFWKTFYQLQCVPNKFLYNTLLY